MRKLTLISSLLISTAIFISCSPVIKNHPSFATTDSAKEKIYPNSNAYGAYLAGRIAHMRKDFDAAAFFYKDAYDKDKNNSMLISPLYLLLASKGNVDEAAVFAQKAIENKDANAFAYMLVSTKQLHNRQYEDSIKTLNKISDPIYRAFIVPMIKAWNYAGLKDSQKAFAEIKKLNKEENLNSIYIVQKALISDYLGLNREAGKIYEQLISSKNSEISVRMLELITNFYIRTNQKERAQNIMNSISENSSLYHLLATLRNNVNQADPQKTPPILSSASIGAAESMFTVASTFRYDDAIDISHMYNALTIYLNPQYSTAKILMGDIYESRDMLEEANKTYDNINHTDIAYYPAQLKKARNLIKQEDYKNAEILLKNLSQDYNDKQIYIDLGDILRITERFNEAVKYYDKAIAQTTNKQELWVLYYAKAVSLERANRWQDAEKVLMDAHKIKKHYLILNHLGYSWIRRNKNIDEAFSMIVDAYNQAPFDPSINDSLGFALYNLGYYTMSLQYLEKAAELYPSSAVISSHLGDAYWFAHRKNEAKFQWRHALKQKDDTGELNIELTQDKIKNGLSKEPEVSYNKEKIEAKIKEIKKHTLSRRLQ